MNNLMGKFVSIWLHPWQTLQGLKQENQDASIKPSMIFLVIMFLVSGIAAAIWGFIVPPEPVISGEIPKWSVFLAIPVFPIFFFLVSFVGTFFLWVLDSGFLKGSSSDYKTLYRLMALMSAFAPVNALLSPIPKVGVPLGFALSLWSLFVLVRGLMIVRDAPMVRSVILGIILVLLSIAGIFLRNEAQRQFQAGANPAFSGVGKTSLGGDLDEDEAALNKELADMADKEKSAAKSDAKQDEVKPAATQQKK